MLSLTAAYALWLVVLSDFRHEPDGVLVFWSIATVAGICAHLVYLYWLPWRGTVALGLIALSVAAFIVLATFAGADDGGLDVLALPIELLVNQSGAKRIGFAIFALSACGTLTAAHPVQPSVVTAIMTALGISIWYGIAILFIANAG